MVVLRLRQGLHLKPLVRLDRIDQVAGSRRRRGLEPGRGVVAAAAERIAQVAVVPPDLGAVGANAGEQADHPERVPPQLALVADPQAEPAGQAAADDDLAPAGLEAPTLGDLEAGPDGERSGLYPADHHVRLGAVDPLEDLDRHRLAGRRHVAAGRSLDAQTVALLRVGALHLGAGTVPHHNDDRGVPGIGERSP
ncbi:MAG: hypothetical protein J4F98_15910 [Acidobacteria bacterium]|nr:hypothetical protein [Acidobacteriota bacterium]